MKNLNDKVQKKVENLNINIKNNNEDNIDIISKIKKIFNHYSTNQYLSIQKFKLFLIESSLLDDIKITNESSNILFYSFSSAKNSINFNSFCKLMKKISSIKFPKKFEESEEKAIYLLYQIYLYPLLKIYEAIDSNQKEKYELTKENLFSNNINHQLFISKITSMKTKEIIEANYLLFLKIYQKYFCFENLTISNYQKNHLAQKAFIKLFEDFHISPSFLSKKIIENIFNIIKENKDYILNVMNNFIDIDICKNDGMRFTLFHFIVGQYLVSIFNIIITNYDDNNPNKIWDIFIHNNDSKALENLIVLFYRAQNIQEVMNPEIKKMQYDIQKEEKEQFMTEEEKKTNISFNKNMNNNGKDISSFKSLPKKDIKDINKELAYLEMSSIIINKHKNLLISIYKYYSELYLETNFSIYMTQNGLINLIKDLNLLMKNEDIPKNIQAMLSHQKFLVQKRFANLLSFTSINILFSKFSQFKIRNGKSGNKKINFFGFINIILIIANKIYNPKFNNILYDDILFSYDQLINAKIKIKYAFNFISSYLNQLYINIFPFIEDDNFSLNNLMVVLKNGKLNYIVNKMIPLFISILKCYNDNKDLIGYAQYFKCLSDFNIFPDFVQRKKMIKIFINFIKDFDDIYLLKGNNKIVSDIKSCAYGIIYIGLGKESESLKDEELEIKLFNFIHKLSKSKNLGKISYQAMNINLQKDFLNAFNEIHKYCFSNNDKKYKISLRNNDNEEEKSFNL